MLGKVGIQAQLYNKSLLQSLCNNIMKKFGVKSRVLNTPVLRHLNVKGIVSNYKGYFSKLMSHFI